MRQWFSAARGSVIALAILALGFLTACVETTYTAADGVTAGTVTQSTTPGYRIVMTPVGLRVITPDGQLIDPNAAPPSVDVANLEPIQASTIAILLPLTGQLESIGQAMKNGADLAINDKGLAGTFDTRVYDTQSTTAGAQAAATKAIQDGAKLILGPLRGDAVAPVARIAARKRVNVVSFSNDITRARNNAYVMGITPEAVTKRVLEYTARRGQRRVAVVAPLDTYGQAAADAANGLANFVGAEIVFTESYPSDPADRPGRTAVAQLVGQRAGSFDALYLPDTAEAGDMASLLYFYGVDPQRIRYLGVPVWDQQANELISEQALLGAIYASPAERGFAAFQSSYRSAFGSDPHPLSSLAYDGVAMALELSASSPNIRFVASDLERPQGFSGVDGPFALRSDKRVERGMAIKRISSLGLELVEDAPSTLYRGSVSSATTTTTPGVSTTTYTTPVTTSTYSTTTVSRTETYTPSGAGGWIGTGENRVWVPASG